MAQSVSKNFYIGDLNYGRKNALPIKREIFKNVKEMNKAIINGWNNVVTEEDTVYILGDMFFCSRDETIAVLKALNGNKVLIVGDNDDIKSIAVRNEYSIVENYLEIKDGDNNVILCHYPIIPFKRNNYTNWFHFYSHIGKDAEYKMIRRFQQEYIDNTKNPCQMYNVGAMMPYMNYVPKTFNEIIGG